jgi:hypothetical protein
MKWIVIAAGMMPLFAPRSGDAEPGLGVVSVTGKVEQHDLGVVARAVEDSVRAAGWSLIDQPLPLKAGDDVLACFFDADVWGCISRIIAEVVCDRDVGWIAAITLHPRSSPQGGRTIVISERLVLANARSFLVDQRACEDCTDAALAGLAGELTRGVFAQAAVRSGRTMISIRSTPRHARFSVDDTFGGLTDAVIGVAPGMHTVTLELEGHERATRTIQAEEGKTTAVAVTLSRLDPARPGEPSGAKIAVREAPSGRGAARRNRSVPATFLFAGGGAVLGSAVLLAANQGQITKPHGEDQPRGYYDTVTASGVLLLAGGVAAMIGGYLWWKDSRSQRRTGATVMVAPVLGGAVLAVHEAF